jgi:hypothetical protein
VDGQPHWGKSKGNAASVSRHGTSLSYDSLINLSYSLAMKIKRPHIKYLMLRFIDRQEKCNHHQV